MDIYQYNYLQKSKTENYDKETRIYPYSSKLNKLLLYNLGLYSSL